MKEATRGSRSFTFSPEPLVFFTASSVCECRAFFSIQEAGRLRAKQQSDFLTSLSQMLRLGLDVGLSNQSLKYGGGPQHYVGSAGSPIMTVNYQGFGVGCGWLTWHSLGNQPYPSQIPPAGGHRTQTQSLLDHPSAVPFRPPTCNPQETQENPFLRRCPQS